MMRTLLAIAVLCVLTLRGVAANWPSWRGPDGNGVSPERDVPLQWSATENVKWKVALPEPGNSSPMVWGDRIFVTQALEQEGARNVMCFHRQDGRLLWQRGTVWKQPEQRYGQNPHAAASPVTDGERVIAFFGSAGLICWDMDGKELWRRDLGRQEHTWSYAASPIIQGDACILYFGPGLNARLMAFDKRTGKTLWEYAEPAIEKRPRTDGFKGQEAKGIVGTFATPLVVRAGDREELVQAFPQMIRAFDPKTGKALWHCDGLNELIYCSPIAADGVLVAMGGFIGNTVAVKTGGSGDVTDSQRLWRVERTKNRLGTGVIAGGHVFVLNTEGGFLECLELKTGKSLWLERLKGQAAKGDSWSSLVLAAGHIFAVNQSGETAVVKAAPQFQLVRVNPLDGELVNASPAISDGEIFIRTHKHLWCIAPKRTQTAAAK